MSSAIIRFSNLVRRCIARVDTNIARTYTSSLFIPGNKANETFSLLSPYLDFDERFDDMPKLRRDLEQRGSQIDADELAKNWQFYKQIDAKKWILEGKRSEIAKRMKQLNKKKILTSDEEKEKIGLITHGKVLKQDIRIIKEALWEMEESVIVGALKLPNSVDEKTPSYEPLILSTIGEINEPVKNEIQSHLDIGTFHGLIDYKNPLNCYLCDEAALFELATLNYAAKHFDDGQMLRISGTDFSRSLVVEAAGLDHEDPLSVFVLSNNEGIDRETSNRLHLVGGSSLVSFLAMHTKQLINPNYFPLRYYATGRQYVPHDENTKTNGLFTICQSSVVHAFVMTQDPLSVEHTNEFDRLSSLTTSFYNSLDVHYRTVRRSANELQPWETMRVSYEMWSANLREYIEIGHLSVCGRYLSKRLLIAYQTPKGRDFPAIISGTVISVPRLLGCLLEENPMKLRIPMKIAEHMRGFH